MDEKTVTTDFKPVTSITAGDLPPVLRIIWNQANYVEFKIANLVTAIACFSAMSPRLRFQYFFDGMDYFHHLLIHAIVVGQSGDGKSFACRQVEYLMAPIIARDMAEEAKELEYSEEKKAKGDKCTRKPPVTVKICLKKATKSKMIKRAHMMVRRYGEPLTFMLYTDELSTMLERRNSYGDLRDMQKLAWDWGATTATDTNSDSSYNATVDINWCCIWCTTPAILLKFMDKDAVESGNANRSIYLPLGDMLGKDAPTFKPYTDEDKEMIKQVQDKLMEETYAGDDKLAPMHDIDMTWLFSAERKWCKYQEYLVDKSGSYARGSFFKRSSLSAARIAAMIYHLWGEDPSKQAKTRKIYYFMADYILKWQLAIFGRKYEQTIVVIDPDENGYTNGTTLFDRMPKRFTREQLDLKRKEMDQITDVSKTISKWKKNRWISQVEGEEGEVFEKNF